MCFVCIPWRVPCLWTPPCQQPSLGLYLWPVFIVVLSWERTGWMNTKQPSGAKWRPNDRMAGCVPTEVLWLELKGQERASQAQSTWAPEELALGEGFSSNKQPFHPSHSSNGVNLNLTYCITPFVFNLWTCFGLLVVKSYKHREFPLSLYLYLVKSFQGIWDT